MFDDNHAPHCDETLGGRMSLARDAKALSIEDAAQRLGVLSASWRAWECDRDAPRANRLTMIAGVLGVSPSWLLTGRGGGPVEERGGRLSGNLRKDIRELSANIDALNRRMREIALHLGNEARQQA